MIALALVAAITFELDLSALVQRHEDTARIRRTMKCGIKVPGHTIIAAPGAVVTLRRARYIVPESSEISFVDLRDSEHVRVNGRRVSLANGEQDQFGFRRVEVGR